MVDRVINLVIIAEDNNSLKKHIHVDQYLNVGDLHGWNMCLVQPSQHVIPRITALVPDRRKGLVHLVADLMIVILMKMMVFKDIQDM